VRMEEEELLTISEASEFLDVSIDTLRRWDKSKKLIALRKDGGTHRYYEKRELELAQSNLLKLASDWADAAGKIPDEYYCQNSSAFQGRLSKLQNTLLAEGREIGISSLVVAVAGEIGNNSFDHNLGNWPDLPGVFFAYDIEKGEQIRSVVNFCALTSQSKNGFIIFCGVDGTVTQMIHIIPSI